MKDRKPLIRVPCPNHPHRTIGKVQGSEWVMETSVLTGANVWRADAFDGWCPDCHAHHRVDGERLRASIRAGHDVLMLAHHN